VKEKYFGNKPRGIKVIFVGRLKPVESWSLLRVSKTAAFLSKLQLREV